MQKHDFFTRIITANCLGPNMGNATAEDDCIVAYECAGCGEEHDDEDEAKDCCRPHEILRCAICRERHKNEDEACACCANSERGQPMQCPVCLSGADSFEDAADCCLHTHPTMTAFGRQRVAAAVVSGTSWIEAVTANVQH